MRDLKLYNSLLVAAAVCTLPGVVAAATINLAPAVVPGTAATGGPSFVTTTAWQPTDVIQAVVAGTVNFDSTGAGNFNADWNAAGVVVKSFTSALSVGGTSSFVSQGWLVLTLGNPILGYFPLFEVSAANGFGSSAPPISLNLSRSVGSIFTSLGTDSLPAGTLLQYRIYDTPTGDNTGAFTVSAVPEPSAIALLSVGGLLLAGIARRKRRGSTRGDA